MVITNRFRFLAEKKLYKFLSLSIDLTIYDSLSSQIGLIGSDQFDKLKLK